MRLKKSVARYLNSQLMDFPRYYDVKVCAYTTAFRHVKPAPGAPTEMWRACYDYTDANSPLWLQDLATLTYWYPPVLLHPFDADWCDSLY